MKGIFNNDLGVIGNLGGFLFSILYIYILNIYVFFL